ncbi:hypothetical protein B0H14DRAFT_2601125 [Mycena olivaceomarginata]|nr:hypothetical protein B0H14DRAFT_2601125 [Mycena olivaceomarginata]
MSNAECGFWATFYAIGGPSCSPLPPFGLPSDISRCGRTHGIQARYIDFPWHQLPRHSGTASYGPLSVLAHAPNIVNCDLHYQSDPHLGSRLIHRMRRLRLRYGALGFDSSSDFLDDVELPALERLALSCDSTDPVALHRSALPLESLEFRFQHPRRSTSRLVDVLTATPALTHLVIWNGARDDMRADASEVFRSLIHSPGLPVPSLLPRLKYLEVSGFELDASFVRMVESRTQTRRPALSFGYPTLGAWSAKYFSPFAVVDGFRFTCGF